MALLTSEQIQEHLARLPGWEYTSPHLWKLYKLKDFESAVQFVNRIVPHAESAGHHPDLEIKHYNEVVVRLTTHDEGGVTEKDTALAERIERESGDS